MSRIKSSKRILAVLLAIVMAFSVIGIVAGAEGETKPVKTLTWIVAPVPSGTEYAELAEGTFVTGFTMKVETKNADDTTTVTYELPLESDLDPYVTVPESWIVTIPSSIKSDLTGTTYNVVGIGKASTSAMQKDIDGNDVPSDQVVSFSKSAKNIIACIIIPASLKAFESGALAGCTKLALVDYQSTCANFTKIINAGTTKKVDDKDVWEKTTYGGGLTNADSILLKTTGGHVYDGGKCAKLVENVDADYAEKHEYYHKALCDVCKNDERRTYHTWTEKLTPDKEQCHTIVNGTCPCGETYSSETWNHVWGEKPYKPVINKDGTSTDHEQECNYCDKPVGVLVEPHTYKKEFGVAKGLTMPWTYETPVGVCSTLTCTKCKYIVETLHNWGAWQDNGDTSFFQSGTQTRECYYCGAKQVRSYNQIAYKDRNGDGKINELDITLFNATFGNCYFGKIFGVPFGFVFFIAEIGRGGLQWLKDVFVPHRPI